MTPKQKRSMFTRKIAASFSPLNVGTSECLDETVSPVVTGADTLLTPTVSDAPEKPKKDKSATQSGFLTAQEVDRLPRFTVRTLGCCGLMEASGIQTYLSHTSDEQIRNVFLGLYISITRQLQHYRTLRQHYTKMAAAYNIDPSHENRVAVNRAEDAATTYGMFNKQTLAGQFIFTAIQRSNSDDFFTAFKKFAEENNLGAVHVTDYFYNPNSTNQVRTVLWSINHQNYWGFLKKYLTREQLF